MASVNKATIIGRLGKDPETRYTAGGEAITNFSVATSETWKDKATGEKKEQTEWHNISTFGKLAEICGQYLKKGSLVYIEGKIQTRKYTDKDGIERYSTGIKADEMRMLGGREEDHATAAKQAQKPAPQRQAAPQQHGGGGGSGGFDEMEDDLPFASPSMAYDMEPLLTQRMRRYGF